MAPRTKFKTINSSLKYCPKYLRLFYFTESVLQSKKLYYQIYMNVT